MPSHFKGPLLGSFSAGPWQNFPQNLDPKYQLVVNNLVTSLDISANVPPATASFERFDTIAIDTPAGNGIAYATSNVMDSNVAARFTFHNAAAAHGTHFCEVGTGWGNLGTQAENLKYGYEIVCGTIDVSDGFNFVGLANAVGALTTAGALETEPAIGFRIDTGGSIFAGVADAGDAYEEDTGVDVTDNEIVRLGFYADMGFSATAWNSGFIRYYVNGVERAVFESDVDTISVLGGLRPVVAGVASAGATTLDVWKYAAAHTTDAIALP